jgi:hypothetical protein
VQPHHLDDHLDRRLRIVQAQNAAVDPQAPGQGGQVEHQRGVTEHQLGEIDDDVTTRLDGPGKGAAPISLRGPVFVSPTTQYRGGVIELDDSRNLHNGAAGGKAGTPFGHSGTRFLRLWDHVR